jgi:protoheme IX farnesyltransferase
MFPVTHGEHYTKVHVLLYTFSLLAVSLLSFVIRMSSLLYRVCQLGLSARLMHWVWMPHHGSARYAASNTSTYSSYSYYLARYLSDIT